MLTSRLLTTNVLSPAILSLPPRLRGMPVSPGIEHDLDALVLLVAEHLVPSGASSRLHPMGDHETGIDLPFLDPFQQGLQVSLHMASARS